MGALQEGIGDVFHLAVAMAAQLEPLFRPPAVGADLAIQHRSSETAPKAGLQFVSQGFLAELKAKAEAGQGA